VLGDEVACAWMETPCQKTTEDQVMQTSPTSEMHKCVVEGKLGSDVEDVDTGKWHFVDEDGTDGIEEDLEGAKECFAEQGVQEEGFEGGGEVSVQPVDAERFVVR